VRTTSAFTTSSEQPDITPGNNHIGSSGSAPSNDGGWGTFGGSSAGAYSNAGIGGDGFGSGGDEGNRGPGGLGQSLVGSRVINNGVEEIVTVTTIQEKEGVFLFQHRNYQVASSRRNSKVIRRYSDFVWLLDCLQKKYPFRQLPLLPPKSVAGKFIDRDPEASATC
jgi:sorting nexin-8